MLVLAVLRHDQRLADRAGGDKMSETTVRRRRDELITCSPGKPRACNRARKKIAKQGGEVVLIGGTRIATQRRTGKADRRNYFGKHHHHGPHFPAPDRRAGSAALDICRQVRPHP